MNHISQIQATSSQAQAAVAPAPCPILPEYVAPPLPLSIPRTYRGPRGHPNVKVRRKCIEVICHPSVIFLAATLLLTAAATALLAHSLTSRYWEMMAYDPDELNKLVAQNQSLTVEWLYDGKVPKITLQGSTPGTTDDEPTGLYLFPLHSGVWISCIDINESQYDEIRNEGRVSYDHCMDHLNPKVEAQNRTEPRFLSEKSKTTWQSRMQNLAIACALVCLILLGAAIVVGLFGILRRQISAVLVTGVIYVLAATFALFTLTIVHLKHKNRNECDPLDAWIKLIPDLEKTEEFRTARLISHGWSLQLAWAGLGVCILASAMWILLSKMMRYNPISLLA